MYVRFRISTVDDPLILINLQKTPFFYCSKHCGAYSIYAAMTGIKLYMLEKIKINEALMTVFKYFELVSREKF